MKKKGFTLIELLVVIAIIAILAAILFPVFAKAREKARQSACANNVKQISMAILNYLQDWDERFPQQFWQGCSWPSMIEPYLKSQQVWYCPSYNTNKANWIVGYAANANIICGNGWGPTDPSVPSLRLADLAGPASIYLLMDAGVCNSQVITPWYASAGSDYALGYLPGSRSLVGSPLGGTPADPSYKTIEDNDYANGRHSGMINMAYCDGHVKAETLQTVWQNALDYWQNYDAANQSPGSHWSPKCSK